MAGVRAVSAVTRSFRCIRRIAGSFVFAENMLGRGFASPTRPTCPSVPPKPAVVEFPAAGSHYPISSSTCSVALLLRGRELPN